MYPKMSHFFKLPLRNDRDAFKIRMGIYYTGIISLNNMKTVFCLEIKREGNG